MPLIINKKSVNKISGPVSMYLLYPKVEYTEIKQNKYAPIFILFGDSHESVENYCNQDEGEEKGYYKVYDVNFLKLFSDAVEGNKESKENKEKSGTIDFYVEGGDLHNGLFKRSIKNYPLSILRNLFKKCYYNTRLPVRKIEGDCNSIKNIRWQSGDIRNFVKRDGRCTLYSEFSYIISKCEGIKDIQEKEKQFKQLLKMSIANNMGKQIIEEFTQDEMFDKHVLNDKCLIYKQLNNINLSDGKAKAEIIENIQLKFKNYIYKNYNILDLYDDKTIDLLAVIPKFKEIHNNIITAFKTSIYSDKISLLIDNIYNYYTKKILDSIMSMILLRDAVLPDLYILARSYKYMYTITDNPDIVYPIINICYFGNDHIIKMREFLIANGYDEGIKIDLISNIGSNQPNRCLDISDRKNSLVNLNELITSIKEDREHNPQ